MTEIIPAIMPKNLEDLKEKAEAVYSHVKTIQLDLMDGEYVEAKTWPFFPKDKSEVEEILRGKALPFAESVSYELDLMVLNPENDLKKYFAFRPSRIIFHARSIENHTKFIETLSKYRNENEEVEIGVAIIATEDLNYADDMIRNTDFVQIMGIEQIGKQGEAFDERVFAQIKNLKNIYPNVIISIDGGVNLENAKRLKDAGVDRLVSGSTIFNSENKEEVISKLRNE
ncbi:MAG: ribulose-phosphate 3-epimerase [Patescibacteria group bacterium]|jgi:ribulose-phosphate 3-epimerase|nr:ribulose-phosphate 3-epimerase [Patescibacteria group bacterium]